MSSGETPNANDMSLSAQGAMEVVASQDVMDVETVLPTPTIKNNKRVISHQEEDNVQAKDASPQRKKAKVAADEDANSSRQPGATNKRSESPTANIAEHARDRGPEVVLAPVEPKPFCPTFGQSLASTSLKRESTGMTALLTRNHVETAICPMPIAKPVAKYVGRDDNQVKLASLRKHLTENILRPGSTRSVVKGFASVDQGQRQQDRTPPLQLASFASETSTAGSNDDFSVEETLPEKPKKLAGVARPKRALAWWKIVYAVLALKCGYYGYNSLMAHSYYSDGCVMVTGGGFSGFYYMNGVLDQNRQDILGENSPPRDFFCYSAGCLSVVSLWSNYSIDQVIDFGEEAQHRYLSGQMKWVQATERMVHNLIHGHGLKTEANCTNASEGSSALQVMARTNPNFLPSLKILTTTFSAWGWPSLAVRSPTNLEELQEMLVQTCWLPFATGNGWIRQGHMDGAFTMLSHPTCPTTIRISYNPRIYLNMVNVRMPAALAKKLYQSGRNVLLGSQ